MDIHSLPGGGLLEGFNGFHDGFCFVLNSLASGGIHFGPPKGVGRANAGSRNSPRRLTA